MTTHSSTAPTTRGLTDVMLNATARKLVADAIAEGSFNDLDGILVAIAGSPSVHTMPASFAASKARAKRASFLYRLQSAQ